jgi:uncharacterized SAM-binding protein YcdF (DUF218 family)
MKLSFEPSNHDAIWWMVTLAAGFLLWLYGIISGNLVCTIAGLMLWYEFRIDYTKKKLDYLYDKW